MDGWGATKDTATSCDGSRESPSNTSKSSGPRSSSSPSSGPIAILLFQKGRLNLSERKHRGEATDSTSYHAHPQVEGRI
jgi:hypothetical protein